MGDGGCLRIRLQTSLGNLLKQYPKQVEVPPERQFVGLDGFKKAIDSLDKGDVVLLATPPAFRPIHLEYAVQKGVNVFMEKSFAVDAPGIRRVLRAGEEATQKNLKVAGGLMSRHYQPLRGSHPPDPRRRDRRPRHPAGPTGCTARWAIGPRQPNESELAYQIANYSCFHLAQWQLLRGLADPQH